MGDEPRAGDIRKCPKCGRLMLVFSKDALVRIRLVVESDATTQTQQRDPGWTCANCGHIQPPTA
jgi:predicted RNA-binding Zn-ribbon protein involved in translation (DUF1610 family)